VGMRILIATDRYMSFQEVRNRPRTYDYPFTFVDIRLNKDGEGEGKMAVATQLQFDKKKNTIVFENYSTEPVRLQQVKVVKAGCTGITKQRRQVGELERSGTAAPRSRAQRQHSVAQVGPVPERTPVGHGP